MTSVEQLNSGANCLTPDEDTFHLFHTHQINNYKKDMYVERIYINNIYIYIYIGTYKIYLHYKIINIYI